MDQEIKLKWALLILMQTPEWRLFQDSTDFMEEEVEKLGESRFDDLEYKNLVLRFENKVINPLEVKWQELLKSLNLKQATD